VSNSNQPVAPLVKKARGRPKGSRNKPRGLASQSQLADEEEADTLKKSEGNRSGFIQRDQPETPKRKRGRPPKNKVQ